MFNEILDKEIIKLHLKLYIFLNFKISKIQNSQYE